MIRQEKLADGKSDIYYAYSRSDLKGHGTFASRTFASPEKRNYCLTGTFDSRYFCLPGKGSVKMWATKLCKRSLKLFCCTRLVGCQKFNRILATFQTILNLANANLLLQKYWEAKVPGSKSFGRQKFREAKVPGRQ